ncbi:HD domain-containing phosphohydrolase [Atopomonas sediminilitoris]|uniref:HD domain-containing phosphohydrolase n=1 Tax=Atopomonas sediminilitoris TaxID=2919919 RepID=UPI001F4E52DD|nr:HD domain-containing phosphohydrolase [Atopomonas sediminilitoris]MCJ8168576.1 Hpt domain-containing protein [Atopomonas sediminilitoris]
MHVARPEDLEVDLLDEFRHECSEQFILCETLLLELEHQPQDTELLRRLFRAVHTVKGNLDYVGLHKLVPLPQAIEELLEPLRAGDMQFDSMLGDVLLIGLDRLRNMITAGLQGQDIGISEGAFAALCQKFRDLATAQTSKSDRRDMLVALDPQTRLPSQAEAEAIAHNTDSPLIQYGLDNDPDLHFFFAMMESAEERSHFWAGRCRRQLNLCLAMNHYAGTPIPAEQLAAAVLLHDFGMAFLPIELLHKDGNFSSEERKMIQCHPRQTHELLRRMPRWQEAADIILCHHEHADGSGYPKHLHEHDIPAGAQIIDIVDTFEARTHERAHQSLSKRPVIRAILEINSQAGRQFSQRWVEVFNLTLKHQPELARA